MAPRALKKNIALRQMERTTRPEDEQGGPLGLAIKFCLLLVFFALAFWLVEGMVQHHFFTGGAMNYHNRPTGP